jgi:hypothetical protein
MIWMGEAAVGDGAGISHTDPGLAMRGELAIDFDASSAAMSGASKRSWVPRRIKAVA